jgi:ppGpp synthetase/RelA/SpoT-type nucleotidyltranferase
MTHLSPHAEVLIQQYRERLPLFNDLSRQVYDQLCQVFREQGIELNSIEFRVKTEESLTGKLERKGDKYHSLYNITDLVGLRIITFYTDDVNKVAAIVKSFYVIDWDNSVDKRKLHQLDSFGYSSLHYICHLKEGPLSDIPFELQIRTALQHVWSAIEHDIGYKSSVKLPPEYIRQFSRLAGLLELADEEFSRLRITMSNYRRHVQALVKNGQLDDVSLSIDSFRSFLEQRPFERLNQRIAAVNQAEIFPVSLLPFLKVLETFQFETLGDVQRFIDENSEDAYQLALSQLAVTDLDILSESIGMQYLCLVYELKQGGGTAGLKFIYDTIFGKNENNQILADMILKQAKTLRFMQDQPTHE